MGKKTSPVFLGNRYLGSGRYLQNAIKTYGKENFSVELLESVNDKQNLSARELYWIDKFNAVNDLMFYNQVREASPGRCGVLNTWDTSRLQSARAKQRCCTVEGRNNLINAAKAACSAEGVTRK